jgi:hypothetical protein
MTALVFALVILGLIGSVALTKRIADEERWEQRAEEARIDHHVLRAERRLRNLTSQAFVSLMDAARRQTDNSD